MYAHENVFGSMYACSKMEDYNACTHVSCVCRILGENRWEVTWVGGYAVQVCLLGHASLLFFAGEISAHESRSDYAYAPTMPNCAMLPPIHQ